MLGEHKTGKFAVLWEWRNRQHADEKNVLKRTKPLLNSCSLGAKNALCCHVFIYVSNYFLEHIILENHHSVQVGKHHSFNRWRLEKESSDGWCVGPPRGPSCFSSLLYALLNYSLSRILWKTTKLKYSLRIKAVRGFLFSHCKV